MSWRFAPDSRGTLPSHEIRRHCGLPIALCIQLRRSVALADCLWLQGNRTVIGRFDHNGLAFPDTMCAQKRRRKGQPRGFPQPLEYKFHFHISAMSCNAVPAYTKPDSPSNIVLRHRKPATTAAPGRDWLPLADVKRAREAQRECKEGVKMEQRGRKPVVSADGSQRARKHSASGLNAQGGKAGRAPD